MRYGPLNAHVAFIADGGGGSSGVISGAHASVGAAGAVAAAEAGAAVGAVVVAEGRADGCSGRTDAGRRYLVFVAGLTEGLMSIGERACVC